MFRFYLRIVGGAVMFVVRKKWRVLGIVLLVMVPVLVNRSFSYLVGDWEGISPWWALAPVGALLGYGMLRVNHDRFEAEREALQVERHEVRRLQALFEERRETAVISASLSYLKESGELLRGRIMAAEDDARLEEWDRQWRDWRLSVRSFVNRYVSPGRAAYVDAIETYDALSLVREGRPAAEAKEVIAQNIDGRLRRLNEVLAEAEQNSADLTRTPTRPH